MKNLINNPSGIEATTSCFLYALITKYGNEYILNRPFPEFLQYVYIGIFISITILLITIIKNFIESLFK